MAVLKEVYDLTLELLDKRDGSGRLEEARLLNLRAKFPALAVRRTQGTEAKRERLAFCCKK